MADTEFSGINLIDGFNLRAPLPLDAREQVDTLVERDNIPLGQRWIGMKTHVVTEGKSYELVGGITNTHWVEIGSGSGGSPSPTVNKGDMIFNDGLGDTALPAGNEGEVLFVENGVPVWKDSELAMAGDWIKDVPLLNDQQTWKDIVELDIIPNLRNAGALAIIIRRETNLKTIDANVTLTFAYSREKDKYEVTQYYAGDEDYGVKFQIDKASHTLQYMTSDMAGTDYVGDFDIRSLNGDIIVKIVRIDNSWLEGIALNNNQSTWTDINEFVMTPEFKRSGSLSLLVQRSTDSKTIDSNITFNFKYKRDTGEYRYSQFYSGDFSGVSFRINNTTNRLQYISDDLEGTNYLSELAIRSLNGAIVIEADALNGSVLVAQGNAVQIPKIDTALRNSLITDEGFQIFNTDTKKFQGYDGTTWVDFH